MGRWVKETTLTIREPANTQRPRIQIWRCLRSHYYAAVHYRRPFRPVSKCDHRRRSISPKDFWFAACCRSNEGQENLGDALLYERCEQGSLGDSFITVVVLTCHLLCTGNLHVLRKLPILPSLKRVMLEKKVVARGRRIRLFKWL